MIQDAIMVTNTLTLPSRRKWTANIPPSLWSIRRYRHDPLLRHIVDAMDPPDLRRHARLVDPWHRDAARELATALVRPDIRATTAIDLERVDALHRCGCSQPLTPRLAPRRNRTLPVTMPLAGRLSTPVGALLCTGMTLLVELWLLARLVALQGIVRMTQSHHGHEDLDVAVAQKMHREPSNFLWPIGRHGDDPHLRNIVDAIDPSDLHRRARFIDPWHRDATSEIATSPRCAPMFGPP